MLNKKDPLIDAIQQVMQSNQADRDAVKAVNEKFGIQDRRVLPRERQAEWDAAYKSVLTEGLHPNQQKLDVHEPEKDKLTKHDFKMLRAKKKPMEEEKKMKGDDPCWDNYEMIGMKKGKGGKSVPNCVPVKEQDYSATQPSKMGLKPDYAPAGTTPDYAKSKEQTPNRAAKTSLPAGTMKEEEQIDEKAPPGAKYERMVKHIKDKMAKGGLTKKEKSIAYATAWKAKKKDVNEGFNNRHDSSLNASADKQVVAEAANKFRSDYGLGAAAAPKNAAVDRAKIDTAMEPVVNVTKAVIPGATAVDKLAQGDYKGAAKDAAISLAGGAVAGGAIKAGKAIYNAVKGTTKAAAGAEKAVTATTKALPSPATAPVKPVSQAAKEPAAAATKAPTAVDNFISKAKSTPVSAAAREGGDAGAKAAANASKYNKPGTVGGRFSDNLAKARKGSENYGPSKGGVAVRKTTEPATVTRPGVPAVAKKPGVPAVANKPGVPAVANRPGLPSTVGSAASTAAKTGRLGKALKYGAVAAAVGGAGYGLMNKSKPDSAGATPATGSSGGSGSSAKPSPGKPVTAKPTSAKPVAASPAASAVKSRLQTRNQRDDTIGASGRSTKGPGGVTSGTRTGKTITNRPVVGKKAPVGTGRVK